MSESLREGTCMKTYKGGEVVVESWLAEGGQGDVYVVKYNGEEKALKWYKPTGMGKEPKAFYENIKSNVMKGSPSPEFLWPLDIIEPEEDGGVFGYVMDKRPAGYYEVSDFMLKKVQFPSYRIATDAALRIVSAYRMLHNNGYSYQDLNDGNFFIEPQSGRVLICDNDNVAPDGTVTGIIGKPRYMAPEIVMHKRMPNSLSDRFSMSVILFILFCLNHPLEGKRSLVPSLTPKLQEKLYGSEAEFIMDPEGRENAPDPEIHKNVLAFWECLPEHMQTLFLRAFSQKALENPNARPTESDWVQELVRFRSEIVTCPCGNEVFAQQGQACQCEKCGAKLGIPYRLQFRDYAIPGIAGSRIYRCQVGPCNVEEALHPVGHVIAKKGDAKALGLKNDSERSWNAVTPSGKEKRVLPGEVVPLKDGIQFTVNNNKNRDSIQIIANEG